MTSPSIAESSSAADLWVVHGQIDIPVCITVPAEKGIERLCVSLGGIDLDGFVELRPLDRQRATTSVFWTASQPVTYEFRAGVKASDSFVALLRGTELAEHLADRLTLLTGYPVRPLSIGFVYNEAQLRQCIAGDIAEYDVTTGGEEAFRTQPPKNGSLLQLLAPPEHAIEAIRWFRHALSSRRKSDQYHAYYIALESIAKHVPGVSRQRKSCAICGKEIGAETQENAAIRYLISRHGHLPANARRGLAKVRARIAHGNADYATLEQASANLPLLQRLAADGIALVLGIDPESLNFLSPRPIDLVAPIGRASYSKDNNPMTDWGCLLSDRFSEFASQQHAQS